VSGAARHRVPSSLDRRKRQLQMVWGDTPSRRANFRLDSVAAAGSASASRIVFARRPAGLLTAGGGAVSVPTFCR
jgi:hypothetical protein